MSTICNAWAKNELAKLDGIFFEKTFYGWQLCDCHIKRWNLFIFVTCPTYLIHHIISTISLRSVCCLRRTKSTDERRQNNKVCEYILRMITLWWSDRFAHDNVVNHPPVVKSVSDSQPNRLSQPICSLCGSFLFTFFFVILSLSLFLSILSQFCRLLVLPKWQWFLALKIDVSFKSCKREICMFYDYN